MSNHSKKRKINKMLFAVSILACVLTVGIALGFMFRETEPVDNKFERAVVSCEVVENFDETTGIKSSITVKNTGNISAYLRVRLVSYWVDADGNIVGKPSKMPLFTLADGWQQTAADTYEYNAPISPNEFTPNLLANGTTMELTKDTDGYIQVVQVFAEAIQSDPANAKDNWE